MKEPSPITDDFASLDPSDPALAQFSAIFQRFQLPEAGAEVSPIPSIPLRRTLLAWSSRSSSQADLPSFPPPSFRFSQVDGVGGDGKSGKGEVIYSDDEEDEEENEDAEDEEKISKKKQRKLAVSRRVQLPFPSLLPSFSLRRSSFADPVFVVRCACE